MLDSYFTQRVVIVPTKRSLYGDIIVDPTGRQIRCYCRFRVIESAITTNNKEERRSDEAMVWFSPKMPIVDNGILFYENRYWKIVKINEARRLGGTQIQFLKCWASSYQVVS